MEQEYIGLFEFEVGGGWHVFEVYRGGSRLLFGSHCNCGFLQSGYMDMDMDFSLDENLSELLADLEVFYTDGPRFVSRIVCNECM